MTTRVKSLFPEPSSRCHPQLTKIRCLSPISCSKYSAPRESEESADPTYSTLYQQQQPGPIIIRLRVQMVRWLPGLGQPWVREACKLMLWLRALANSPMSVLFSETRFTKMWAVSIWGSMAIYNNNNNCKWWDKAGISMRWEMVPWWRVSSR